MNLIIVSIHDTAADAFQRPFVAAAKGQAIRAFQDEVNRDGSEMFRHPEDYRLFQLGTFDDNSGEIKGQKPELLITGLAVSTRHNEIQGRH